MQTDLCAHTASAHLNILVCMGGVKTVWFGADGIHEEPEMLKSVLCLRAVKNSIIKIALFLGMPSFIFSRKNVVTTFVTLGLSSLSSGTRTRLSSFPGKNTSLLPNLTILFWNVHFSKRLFCEYHLYQHLGAIFYFIIFVCSDSTALRKWALLNCMLKEAAKFALMSF